jgi:hypothetical protein
MAAFVLHSNNQQCYHRDMFETYAEALAGNVKGSTMDTQQKLANLSATMAGSMQAQADELERIKNELVEAFGFPQSSNITYVMAWSSLDNMQCRMRELVSEWDATNSEDRS